MSANISVPLLDLKAQFNPLREKIRAAIDSVCESQRFILGPHVAELERRIADYCDAEFAIGVSSGTDALLVALMALDIGPDSAVITTPYTFFATAGAIARTGAQPIFCDIDPKTYNLSPATVNEFITRSCELRKDRLIHRETGRQVSALMPVHLFGQMADMTSLMNLARKYHLKVIEDAAQALGAKTKEGETAGSIGDIGCFSFFPSKNLGAFGDGGMCVTNNAELADKLRRLRVHGSAPKYYHSVIGGNFRLDELQAAILLVKLDYLDNWTFARQDNAARYTTLLANAGCPQVSSPEIQTGYRHIFNQYVIRAKQRDALKSFVENHGIQTEVYYPLPLHTQACFKYLDYHTSEFPVSIKAAAETLALPIYPEIGESRQRYVVDTIADYYRLKSA